MAARCRVPPGRSARSRSPRETGCCSRLGRTEPVAPGEPGPARAGMNGVTSVLSMGVTVGLIAPPAALLGAAWLGVAWRRRAGQFRPPPPGTPVKPAGALTEADLGTGLGRQA